MSILFRGERRSINFPNAADLVRMGRDRSGSGNTAAGVNVTPDSAQRHSAVWACQSAIAEAVQQLPLQEVRTSGDITRRLAPPPVFYEPAPGMSWETWIWQQTWTLAGRGRAYGYVTGITSTGVPTGIVPVDPDCVSWRWNRRTSSWDVLLEREPVQLWPLGPLWHCPLYATPSNPEGMSPIAMHAESIGVGLAAQKFGGQFFGDGAHPTMVASVETDPGEAGAKALKQKLLEAMQGNREPVVVPQSIKLEKWQVSPDEAQFLETMRYSGEDVARIFGVPPSKIGLAVSGQNVTYSNVSDANTEWRTSGLSRYVVALEAGLSRLVPNGSRRVLRFNFDEFLRPDPEKRYSIYKLASEIGDIAGTPPILPNEMRLAEGRDPLPGGDEFQRKQPAPAVATRNDPTVTLIDQRPIAVDARQEPPTVNVAGTTVNVEPAQIAVDARTTVEPASVTVQPSPAPVVNVAPAEVRIELPAPAEQRATRKIIEHTADGRIAAIIEEPIE